MKPQNDATLRWATTLIIGITGCLPVMCILKAIVFRKSHAIWKRDYASGVLGVLAILSFAMQFSILYSLCGFENAYRQLEFKKNSGD